MGDYAGCIAFGCINPAKENKMSKVYSVNDLPKAIASIKVDGERLQDKIHNVLLSIVKVWGRGECDGKQAAQWFDDVAEGSLVHKKKVIAWIVQFTPVKYATDTKRFFCKPDSEGDYPKPNGDNFKAGRENPFYKFKADKPAEPVDLLGALEKVLERNDKRAKSDKKMADDILLTPEIANQLRAILNAAK